MKEELVKEVRERAATRAREPWEAVCRRKRGNDA